MVNLGSSNPGETRAGRVADGERPGARCVTAGRFGPTVTVRVRLFGALAGGAGSPVVSVPVEVPTTAGAVVAAVQSGWPTLAALVERS